MFQPRAPARGRRGSCSRVRARRCRRRRCRGRQVRFGPRLRDACYWRFRFRFNGRWLQFRGGSLGSHSGLRLFARHREPVVGRKRDAPNIPGNFKLQADLKKFADCAGTLDPDHPPDERPPGCASLGPRDFQGDGRVLGNVVLRLVLAAVAVDHDGRGALFERLPERIDTRDRDWHGLDNSRASTLLLAGIFRW